MPSVFYLDLWPISTPFMMVHDPGVAHQMTQAKALPKHPINGRVLGPLTGHRSIITAEGGEWKFIRTIINPAFSTQYLYTILPVVLKHAGVFKDRICHYASTGEVFPIQETATGLTIDIIGEVVMGVNFDSQHKPTELTTRFQKAVLCAASSMDGVTFHLNRIPRWWHCRQQDRIIEKTVRDRYAETKSTEPPTSKAAIDLFLQAYLDGKFAATKSASSELDPDFMSLAVDNIKSLLLGGHDTTASTIAYIVALLSEPENRDELERVRMEHDGVFGPGL